MLTRFPLLNPSHHSQRPSTTGMDHVRPRHVCPVQDRVRRQRGERGRDGDLQRMKVKGSRRESMPWQAPPPPHPQPHPLAPEVERCSTNEPHTAAAKRTVDVSTHIGSLRVYMILIKVTCHRRAVCSNICIKSVNNTNSYSLFLYLFWVCHFQCIV